MMFQLSFGRESGFTTWQRTKIRFMSRMGSDVMDKCRHTVVHLFAKRTFQDFEVRSNVFVKISRQLECLLASFEVAFERKKGWFQQMWTW